MMYSQVNKGSISKEEEMPFCEAPDANGEIEDRSDMMEETKSKSSWIDLQERELTLEEILALETEFLPPKLQLPNSTTGSILNSTTGSILSELDNGDTDYPYFCREGRATVRRPVLMEPTDDPSTIGLVTSDQDRNTPDATLATGAQHQGMEGQAKIVIYVGFQLAKLWQLEQEECPCLN